MAWLVLGALLLLEPGLAAQQQAGSIRGMVHDKDFDAPLAAAQVLVVELDLKVTTSDRGDYVFGRVDPGTYTLVFSKEGYVRQVRADVVVSPGRLTDVNASLAGEFLEMEEFIVQDVLQLGGGTEIALLNLRFESPAMMDSISADLMSRAGAGDAASALKLVSGATVKDGKSAVIRGLPDRYVSSQMNGVRLPSADEDKRAVELDQFPSTVIESIQVSKTFTPDQQGDASGGAVDVRLRGIPEQIVFSVKSQLSYNTQATGNSDFLTYDGGGVNFWGSDGGGRDIQYHNLGNDWNGATGVRNGNAPIDSKGSVSGGGKYVFDNGITVGGFVSLFYERDSSFHDNGREDNLWLDVTTREMVPRAFDGNQQSNDIKTGLFDVTQSRAAVQWGSLATVGAEFAGQSFNLTYLYTHVAEDTTTLAIDTRGKEWFFPGYDPNDILDPGNSADNIDQAPYLRLETLEYTERTTETLQLNARHELPVAPFGIEDWIVFRDLELDWTVADSAATLSQPDKRQFGAEWRAERRYNGGFSAPPIWSPYKPSANFTLGNFQRIWKEIAEESRQASMNFKLPFEQWASHEGFLKVGTYYDKVDRDFNQDSFSNFNDNASWQGPWNPPWSSLWGKGDGLSHPVTESFYDVDYKAEQSVTAWYAMVDMPLDSWVNIIGGFRVESTEIGIVNTAEKDVKWYPPGAQGPNDLDPGEADVSFSRQDLLPAIGLEVLPFEDVKLRASYSRTVARQTFKELTPIIQQEFLGGPIFIGNPTLDMSTLDNYDVRADYTPFEGGLFSVSGFYKKIEDPIEYVQEIVVLFNFTTARNYPEGRMLGLELEARQDLGIFWKSMEGLALGANATFIESEVTLTDQERIDFAALDVPMSRRDMTNAPEYIYNLYTTYDIEETGTKLAAFYTFQGDTLLAGAAETTGNLVPSIYAREYGTLNLSLSQKLGEYFSLKLQAKNLTNPSINTVYRSKYIGDDVTRTSYTKGTEYAISIGAKVAF